MAERTSAGKFAPKTLEVSDEGVAPLADHEVTAIRAFLNGVAEHHNVVHAGRVAGDLMPRVVDENDPIEIKVRKLVSAGLTEEAARAILEG